MPRWIAREEAIRRLGPIDGCTLCRLNAIASDDVLHDDGEVVVRLSRYPVRWGHLMIVPRPHVTRFLDVELALWLRTSELAHRAARAIERALAPSRCYVASLGAARTDLPMTFAHVHVNVIPVPDEESRPRDVLTWQHGVLDGTEDEWRDLRRMIRRVWDD